MRQEREAVLTGHFHPGSHRNVRNGALVPYKELRTGIAQVLVHSPIQSVAFGSIAINGKGLSFWRPIHREPDQLPLHRAQSGILKEEL